ncbi:MAG: hypothetical protein KGH65_01250 [Candidatus Micrarchaeota archaeon]|nr:hypothetical protein [Candidatus Micrarchaeota archaeon]
MREFRFGWLLGAFMLIILLSGTLNAYYWFQFGARAGSIANQNSGASVTIQTISPQMSNSGSLGYWVGETLDNGAFLQVGYVIENQSGMYPSRCNTSGCGAYEQIKAGDAQWFYEYFPSGFDGAFLGAIGPDNSAGINGTFHNYAFYYSGNVWHFKIDGNEMGNVSLGASSSGVSVPVAFGEVANTSGVYSVLPKVIFSNLSVYRSGSFIPVQQGLAYIGYGVGSQTNLKNPYGVEELYNRSNYFVVGSNLAQPHNNTQLWNLGYNLVINSSYANISSDTKYIAYSEIGISSPSEVQINSTVREKFVGWHGTGLGSYSGPANSTIVTLDGNITETALWQKQYLLNVSSQYGSSFGGGWYFGGSTVNYGVESGFVQNNAAQRQAFAGWSNGNREINGTLVVDGPSQIRATWNTQYLVNIISQYGNVSGGGWYYNNSLANISISFSPMAIDGKTKLGFFGWSNGNRNSSFAAKVSGPIVLTTQFRDLYLTGFAPQSASGTPLEDVALFIGDMNVTNGTYLFGNQQYSISYAYYKGVKMTLNSNFSIEGAGTVSAMLPVYNVNIATRDLFGMPVNSLASMQFSNGTVVDSYTGSAGRIALENVPYGFVEGNVTYLGIKQQLGAREGSGAGALFISILNIEVFTGVGLVILIAFFVARCHFRDRTQPGAPQINL